MDIMNLLAEARPSSLDPRPDPARRASDLARAIGAPRAATGASRRRLVRRPAPPWRRVIAIGTSIAALAGTAGVVVALSFTGAPAARPQPTAAHTGTRVTTSAELLNAILTAINAVSGDVFYTRTTEILAGAQSGWSQVSENWSYPLQPQNGQKVYVRNLVLPLNPKNNDKTDTEWIYTEPTGGESRPYPGQPGWIAQSATKTEMIDVQYGNRTWSDTTGDWGFTSETMILQNLRDAITQGKFQHVRKTKLHGRTVLELTSYSKLTGTMTWWVDPATYLPVQMLNTVAGSSYRYQVDYEFLPPTSANIAQLKVTIPAGFTRTPTQEIP